MSPEGKLLPDNTTAVQEYLASGTCVPVAVIETDGRAIVLDLSRGSLTLGAPLVDIDVTHFGKLVDQAMSDAGTAFAFGRYAEDRELYNNNIFASRESTESRSIHMGVDLFCAADTSVLAPLDATVAIIANNKQELDYGPMLVLRHDAGGCSFYSLYGHLNLQSIAALQTGQQVTAGEQIATVGSPPENGNWPPHLHFQLIVDLLNLGKDFPGVARASETDYWLNMSPSPALFFPECDAEQLNCETR